MLPPAELDGVTLLVDVPAAGLRAGDVGVIVAITRADNGRLRYTIEIDRPDEPGATADGQLIDLDAAEFGLD
ncbi:MAG: DUF4926 domain-containing protein [Caulobacteraceae bacterium]|nr:hypothetical protein [Caulobacter sp.]RYF94760.1 MAG: DUF4926 domain-containing protein [Caulobacteraceae bacterium]